MLAGLDRIDWSTLHHAYGAADDVPALLGRLTWPDRDTQEQALAGLCDRLEHQGSLYSATVAAVPFLLRFAADPAFAQRRALLEFLTFIAPKIDHDWWHAMQHDPEALHRHVDTIVAHLPATDTPAVQATVHAAIKDEIVARAQVYDAVRTGLPLYRALLADDDPDIRIGALELLTAFDQDYAESLPAVRARIAVERDMAVLARLVDALRDVADAAPWCLTLCERLLDTHPSPDVRLAAANTLVHLQAGAAPAEAITRLADAYAERDEFAPGVWPLHISTPHGVYGGAFPTDAGIQGLGVDQIILMAAIMLRGLATRTPQDDWDDYGRRVERIAALLFELPAARQGAAARLDELRHALIATAAPVLIVHITRGPQAWTARDNAELLLRLAYPYAAQLAGSMTPEDIADLRVATLGALAQGDFWHHTLKYLPFVERTLTTITTYRDDQTSTRRADLRAAERALLTAILADVRPTAPLWPQIEATVARFAALLA